MPRKRSPQEKKKLDRRKQRRGFSEYHHSLRHGKWRKTKRRPAQKSERQAERLAVSTRAGETLADAGFDAGPIVRPSVGKRSPAPLGQWIVSKKADRQMRAGGKQRRRLALVAAIKRQKLEAR